MTNPVSVSFDKDSQILELLINLHCPVECPVILDCTYNCGVMWRGSSRSIKTLDIDSSFDTDYVGDFRDMHFIKDETFDILVFDPPHLPVAAASAKSSKIWEKRYGITSTSNMGRDGDSISDMFLPFLKEAQRILKKNGIILAKISDIVHNHKYQWQHVDFINCAKNVGLTPCDILIKVRNKGPVSGKWKSVRHLRRCHTYWIVCRKGKCESAVV